MAAEPPRLSVIVPTYGRPSSLLRLLRELEVQDLPDRAEVIVVDDGSPTPLAPHLDGLRDGFPFSLTCLRQENAGAPAARNAGASEARGECLLFVDDDIGVAPEFLRAHMEAQRVVGPAAISAVYRDEPTGLPGPLADWYRARSDAWARGAREGYRPVAPGIFAVDGPLLSSTNLSVPAAAFRAVGGFDRGYGAPSCEDMDLGVRLARQGTPVFRIATTTPRHLETRTSFRQVCERQRTGARETVRLVSRFPEVFGEPPVARACGPLRWRSEPPVLTAKKLARAVLARPLVAPLVFSFVRVSTRAGAPVSLRHRLYEAVVGAYIQRGWREGLARQKAERT